MAAPTEEIGGINLLLSANGTVIGGQEDGTLTFDPTVNEVNTKTSGGWSNSLLGLIGWGIDFSGLYIDSDDSPERGFGATLSIAPDDTTTENIKALSEVTLTIEMEAIEVSNQDHAGFTISRPSIRSWSIQVVTDYIDPATDPAAELVWNNGMNGGSVYAALNYGANEVFEGTAIVELDSLEAPGDDIAQLSFTLNGQDDPATRTQTVDTGLQAVLDAIAGPEVSEITALFQLDTAPVGSTYWTGATLVESVEITINANEPVSVSGSLIGAEALQKLLVA